MNDLDKTPTGSYTVKADDKGNGPQEAIEAFSELDKPTGLTAINVQAAIDEMQDNITAPPGQPSLNISFSDMLPSKPTLHDQAVKEAEKVYLGCGQPLKGETLVLKTDPARFLEVNNKQVYDQIREQEQQIAKLKHELMHSKAILDSYRRTKENQAKKLLEQAEQIAHLKRDLGYPDA